MLTQCYVLMLLENNIELLFQKLWCQTVEAGLHLTGCSCFLSLLYRFFKPNLQFLCIRNCCHRSGFFHKLVFTHLNPITCLSCLSAHVTPSLSSNSCGVTPHIGSLFFFLSFSCDIQLIRLAELKNLKPLMSLHEPLYCQICAIVRSKYSL